SSLFLFLFRVLLFEQFVYFVLTLESGWWSTSGIRHGFSSGLYNFKNQTTIVFHFGFYSSKSFYLTLKDSYLLLLRIACQKSFY
ncbi:MAG: hypothetical protein MK212_21950, partial [Saprospiraceae bacterium]|nr:hypothetical protein [Saprospiraceae bacterium]